MSTWNPMSQRYEDAVHDEIRRTVEAQSRARAEQIERACEQALQGGQHGVLVDGPRITVDHRVPYGRIVDATTCGADNIDWSSVREPH